MINKIKQLRNKFKQFNIDGYIVPKNDEFFSEYAATDRLKIISDFSGNAACHPTYLSKQYKVSYYK